MIRHRSHTKWILFDEDVIKTEREQNILQRQRMLFEYLKKSFIAQQNGKTVPLEVKKMIELMVKTCPYSNVIIGLCMFCGEEEAILLL